MIFHKTSLAGAYIVEQQPICDERGSFARAFCEREFAQAGLETRFVNINRSISRQAATLRGLHYQVGEAAEVKLVTCVRGALFDLILDLRPDSRTYLQHFGQNLRAGDGLAIYVPRGFAHAILTLEEETEALYLVSAYHDSGSERGLRWDDPRLGLAWPIAPQVISKKDASWPDFEGFA